jgi:hypothetical protein
LRVVGRGARLFVIVRRRVPLAYPQPSAAPRSSISLCWSIPKPGPSPRTYRSERCFLLHPRFGASSLPQDISSIRQDVLRNASLDRGRGLSSQRFGQCQEPRPRHGDGVRGCGDSTLQHNIGIGLRTSACTVHRSHLEISPTPCSSSLDAALTLL